MSQSRLIIVKLGGLMSHKFSIEPLEIKNVKKFMVGKNIIDLTILLKSNVLPLMINELLLSFSKM